MKLPLLDQSAVNDLTARPGGLRVSRHLAGNLYPRHRCGTTQHEVEYRLKASSLVTAESGGFVVTGRNSSRACRFAMSSGGADLAIAAQRLLVGVGLLPHNFCFQRRQCFSGLDKTYSHPIEVRVDIEEQDIARNFLSVSGEQ